MSEQPEPFLESEVAFRLSEPGDIDFIYSSWLESFRASWEFKEVNGKDYWDGLRKVIARILQRYGVDVVIAHNPLDREQILGWCCEERGSVIHYVYVKAPFRRRGLARMLLKFWSGDKKRPSQVKHSFRQKTPGAERLVEWLRSHYSPFNR